MNRDEWIKYIEECPLENLANMKYHFDNVIRSRNLNKIKGIADQVLQAYFRDNSSRIESWFNIITPVGVSMLKLHAQLSELRDKQWTKVHLA